MVETNKETLKRRDEIVAEMDELLKHRRDTSIYSELHRIEGIMARTRVNWQEQQLKTRDTSPQKIANEEDAQGTDVPYSFVNRCVNEVKSLPISVQARNIQRATEHQLVQSQLLQSE